MKLECGHKSIGVFAARLELQRDEARVDEDRRSADESEDREKRKTVEVEPLELERTQARACRPEPNVDPVVNKVTTHKSLGPKAQ